MKDIGVVLKAPNMTKLFSAFNYYYRCGSVADCECVVDDKPYDDICFARINKNFKKIRYFFEIVYDLGAALEYIELQPGFLFDDVPIIHKDGGTKYHIDLENSALAYPQLCVFRVLQEEPSLVPVYNCLVKSFEFNPVSAWMVLHCLRWNYPGHSFADNYGNTVDYVNNIPMILYDVKRGVVSSPGHFFYTSKHYGTGSIFKFKTPEDLFKFKNVKTVEDFKNICN